MIEIKSRADLEFLKGVQEKRRLSFDEYEEPVRKIIDDVKKNGDKALFEYTRRFDGYDANKETAIVSNEEFDDAEKSIPEAHKEVIQCAADRIWRFHEAFKPKSQFIEEDGAILGVRVTPVERAGLYIPGGKAAYPSTALMTVIPAIVAGVKHIQIATPSKGGRANPYVLYIAKIYGIREVFKIGGAQSIAAFAYSTESVPKVDVIAGPGNIYVALAKRVVFGDVGIDSIAGPSEIMVVADKSANPVLLARDLLSQAEHDELAGCFLVGLSRDLVLETEKLFMEYAKSAKRSYITQISAKNSVFIFTGDLELAARCVDIVAPEHLELQLEDNYGFMNMVNHAGAIFIGPYSPEPIGDYVAGPNHTLPTSSTARFFSPLSCDAFMKKSSFLHFTKRGFERVGKCASEFALVEGLFAHRESVDARFKNS